MRRGSLEKRLPYECFTEEKLDILLCPTPGWESLKEHHDFLKVHLQKLVGPFDKKGNADIQVELGEALLLGLDHYQFQRLLKIGAIPTIYVSHILMVFLTLISLIKRQFIHRKLNCINSTPSVSRCFARGPSILAVRS